MFQVLIATSTLAWGVNFPAHLVIVKGTEFYDGKTRRYVDYPITGIVTNHKNLSDEYMLYLNHYVTFLKLMFAIFLNQNEVIYDLPLYQIFVQIIQWATF